MEKGPFNYSLRDNAQFCEQMLDSKSNLKETNEIESSDMIVNLPSYKSEHRDNPYWNFFKRPTNLNEEKSHKNLHQRADASLIKLRDIISKIIKDFETTDLEILSDDHFNRLFEIIFDIPATSNVIKSIKPLPTLTQNLAKINCTPKASQTYTIYSNIRKNRNQISKPEIKIAFGKCLPSSMRKITPSDISKKWILPKLHEDLFTMSTTFNGIENLTSTKEFCKWLEKHPDKQRPIYLEKNVFF